MRNKNRPKFYLYSCRKNGKIRKNVFENNYCIDIVNTNFLAIREYNFMIHSDKPMCRMMNPMISFGATKTDKSSLTVLEFRCSNAAGALLALL
jgi:hypothetical protein